LLLLPLLSFAQAKDVTSLLAEASKLKHAEKYQEAEKLYDEVLKIEPGNKEALQGKDDCFIMLNPPVPMQHLMPTMIDPEYIELIDKSSAAKTPWEKRRAEMAMEMYAVRYTGKVFGEAGKKFNEQAAEIIERAQTRIKNKEDSNKVYLETEKELKELQKAAHQGWKGHGPEFLQEALGELNKVYKEKGLPNPSALLTLEFKTSPKATKEGTVVELTVSLTNNSKNPIILNSLQIDGSDYQTFTWQKAMYGSLNYEKKEDKYIYNPLAQQETYGYFNVGLLFPGQTTSFTKSVRLPQPEPTVNIEFNIADEETIKYIYLPKENSDEYLPASLEQINKLPHNNTKVDEKGLFPTNQTIIFLADQVGPRQQTFEIKE
ncbi:MAG: hypothetical protein KKA31_02000, partial [Candidatus Margulisbacteria bacterium]|nr:hypothetical protein [Candidatus Margulisiibacteriota bacterium]